MNSMNTWIEHLHHPLVFAGFGLFIFALLLRPLFLNNNKLTGTATERLLHRGMILVFILALLAIIGGIALNWKATPEAAPKPVEKTATSEGIQQYEERLRVVEQQLLAMQASGTMTDDKERHLLEAQLKGVQEKLGNLQTSYEEELKRRKAADKALVEMKGQLPDARIASAQKSLEQGDTTAAEQVFDEVVDKEGKSVALAAYQSGQLAAGRLDYAKAMRQYKQAMALEEDNPDYLLATGNMARTIGDYNRAQAWLERLLKIREGDDKIDINLGTALNSLALTCQYQGDYKKAGALYQRALAITEKLQDKASPNIASTLNNLASLYQQQGHYAEAESLYMRALKIKEKIFGKEHPDVATALNNLAGLYKSQGRYEQAESLYKRALDIVEKTLGKKHPHIATSLDNLAALYYAQGRYEQEEPLHKRALEIYKQSLGKDHPDVAATLNNLANLYQQQGLYEQAEPLYKRALEIERKKLGKDHLYVATSLWGLAVLYKAQKKYNKAEPLYKRALSIYMDSLPAEHPDIKEIQTSYDDLKRKMAKQ